MTFFLIFLKAIRDQRKKNRKEDEITGRLRMRKRHSKLKKGGRSVGS